jgi:spore coat protein U-like protein
MGTRPTLSARALRSLCCALALAASALICAPATAQNAQPQTVTVEARATVISLGSLVKARDLHFGDIIAGPTPGTVRVAINGTRTSTGGVTLVGSSHQAALFVGMGRRNQQIEISFATPTILITGPGAPMTVSLFEIGELDGSLRGNRPGRYRITTSNGRFEFPVGATLLVNANQRPGTYTGTFTVLYEFQ